MVIGLYKYGMRLRPYGMGCQPMENYVCCDDGATADGWRYHNFVYYTKRLSEKDADHFDLDYFGYTLMEINERKRSR